MIEERRTEVREGLAEILHRVEDSQCPHADCPIETENRKSSSADCRACWADAILSYLAEKGVVIELQEKPWGFPLTFPLVEK